MGQEKDEIKDAMKEALKEWLDDKFTTFGKFTAIGLATALLGGLVYITLYINGWKPPI